MSGEGKVVCVTGASGFIASWIVKLLLDRGYTVKGTVRSLSDPNKMDHLLSLHGAKERLQLFEANLIEEGSFDSVVDGCEGVFHTASPVLLQCSNPQDDLIKPAVEGTQNVLCSCAKVPSIKRVVLTSSMAAVSFNNRPRNPDVVIDETWFSDPVYCEESKLFYHLSKTLAEDAAWKFARENGIDLVTINPGFVIGPLLQPNLNQTSEMALNLIKNGSDGAVYRYVDVRDVALAHILAYEVSSASGRYCLVGTVTRNTEAVNILRKLYPTLNLPERLLLRAKRLEEIQAKHPALFKKFGNMLDHKVTKMDLRKLPNLTRRKLSDGIMRLSNIMKIGDGLNAELLPNMGMNSTFYWMKVSKKKAESLGVHFTPLEVTLRDTVESLKEKNFLF